MSWNKNTIVFSSLDDLVRILRNVGASYTLTTLGEVAGRGLNDEEGRTYPIRKLQHPNAVVLEQMRRACDCDSDDYLEATEFSPEDEPAEWPLEVVECVCGNNCGGAEEQGEESDEDS